MTPSKIRERVARAICAGCEENPYHQGDARGNDYRWQDYLGPADAALDALGLGYGEKIVGPGALNDAQCDQIISRLDEYAREKCSYEYGLPMFHDDAMSAMREVVREAASA